MERITYTNHPPAAAEEGTGEIISSFNQMTEKGTKLDGQIIVSATFSFDDRQRGGSICFVLNFTGPQGRDVVAREPGETSAQYRQPGQDRRDSQDLTNHG